MQRGKPHAEHGAISYADQDALPDSVFAFPTERKEPLTDGAHVHNALARFDQVKGVSNRERGDVRETDWRELGTRA